MIATFSATGVAILGCASSSVVQGLPSDTSIVRIYPTREGGREWLLPVDAQLRSDEWQPETATVVQVGPGVFRTAGSGGEVRLNVMSPDGKEWWRDIEMTGYFRAVGTATGGNNPPHWEMLARGERHSITPVDSSLVNGGVLPPPGTVTWPGYPFPPGSVNVRCLGTAYHGNVYADGRTLFEKEISHIGGYGQQRGVAFVDPIVPSVWFGMKFVLGSAGGGARVHLELWLDPRSDGTFAKVGQYEDDPGAWPAQSNDIDGCTIPPFGYAADQLIYWAGPWVTFRSDALAIEFSRLSVREIAPLP